jgi:hypothetical protein
MACCAIMGAADIVVHASLHVHQVGSLCSDQRPACIREACRALLPTYMCFLPQLQWPQLHASKEAHRSGVTQYHLPHHARLLVLHRQSAAVACTHGTVLCSAVSCWPRQVLPSQLGSTACLHGSRPSTGSTLPT